jgi:hypothetical protein
LQQELQSPFFAQLELTDLVQRGKTDLALDDICRCLPKPAILSVRHIQNGLVRVVVLPHVSGCLAIGFE